jgi:MFS family permease
LVSFGGILGAIGMGVAFDVTRPVRALVGGYFVAMVAITLLGWGNSSGVLFAVITVAGAAVIGGQAGVQTYAAQRYSTEIRSAGLGWLLGVGRLGSIFGPLLGGAMIGLGWPVPAMFAAATIPVALAAIGIPVADRFGRE